MKGEATKAGAEHARVTDPVDLPRLIEDRAELTRVVEDHVIEDRGERTRMAYEAERLRAARLMGEIIAPAATAARHLGAKTMDAEIEGALRHLLQYEPESLAKILAMAEAADRIITEQRAGGEQQQEGPRPS
jgi:hypothetical protein